MHRVRRGTIDDSITATDTYNFDVVFNDACRTAIIQNDSINFNDGNSIIYSEGADPNTATLTWSISAFKDSVDLMEGDHSICLLYTSPSPRDRQKSRMPSSA